MTVLRQLGQVPVVTSNSNTLQRVNNLSNCELYILRRTAGIPQAVTLNLVAPCRAPWRAPWKSVQELLLLGGPWGVRLLLDGRVIPGACSGGPDGLAQGVQG